MSDKSVIIVGYSGHAYVLIETVLENGLNVIGYSDKEEVDHNPYSLEYLGFEKDKNFAGWGNHVTSFVIGLGDNRMRQNIAILIESKGKVIETVIHHTAHVSKNVSIGNGTFINKNVSVNALASIGKHVILNTGCIVEHECILNDAVHIGPGAVLAGNVKVGERTFVGANSVIKQGITIGKDVIIGAGAVIITDIPDGKKVIGNPGRII
ncbi:acetyltransferase [Flavobacterium sp.]|uniref:acetyltransferase n=1 Tax=Flavobacterium sp. TaxID=239 RepID=UPI0025C2799B|nr:acetyltransferase [Flavobacterium sp.]